MNVAIVIALATTLAAVALFLSSRSARRAASASEKEVVALRAETEAARKELASIRSELKERRDEVSSLRNDLRDSKKKAFEQAEAAKKLGGAAALREEIDKLSARLAEARAEAAHGTERVKGLEAQLEKVGQELEKARAAAQRKPEPAPAPSAPEPSAAPSNAAIEAQRQADTQKLAAERERADKAEVRLAEARKRIGDLDKDVKNLRGRLETEKRVYMVQKGELDLAADRYAELKRRNDALRKDHEELLEAVRQAAREDRRLAETEKTEKTRTNGDSKGEHAA